MGGGAALAGRRAPGTGEPDGQPDRRLRQGVPGSDIACARCHYHKFDPISQRDYYGMAGYLRTPVYQQAYLDAPERITEKARKLDAMRRTAHGGPPSPPTPLPSKGEGLG